MRLIDRHIFSQWLKSFMGALAVTVGILILQCMYDTLPDLIGFGASYLQIVSYYLALIPGFFPTIIPLALLISLLFALGYLRKTNEVTAICTLSEKHYHFGVGSLINSLYHSGFCGDFYCGYRGELPTWARSVEKIDDSTSSYRVGENFKVYFIKLTTDLHFALYKPRFMLDLLSGLAADVDQIYYFDPDITVKCPWQILETWAQDGIALCEDSYSGFSGFLPDGHPHRLAWKEWIKKQDKMTCVSVRDRYYNSGFIGVQKQGKNFLELWDRIIQLAIEEIGTHKQINFKTREHIFYIPDQNALNIALMCHPITINASGLEGMDFASNGRLMSHAVRQPKPWHGEYLKRALFGTPPSEPEQEFIKFLNTPIKVFPDWKTAWLRASMKVARLIAN